MVLLVNNPYEGSLNAAVYQQKIAELDALLQSFVASQDGTDSALTPAELEEQQKTKHLHDYYSSALQFTMLVTVRLTTRTDA